MALHHEKCMGCAATLSHNRTIGRRSRRKSLRQHSYYVWKMIVNRASTTSGLATWQMQGLCGDIDPELNYRPRFQATMLSTTSSLCPEKECQRSVNDFRHCILEGRMAMWLHWSIIELPAAFPGNNAYNKVVTMSQNERQQIVNNFWSSIFDNLTALECRYPTLYLSAACIEKNTRDNIASPSYNWVPTERQ